MLTIAVLTWGWCLPRSVREFPLRRGVLIFTTAPATPHRRSTALESDPAAGSSVYGPPPSDCLDLARAAGDLGIERQHGHIPRVHSTSSADVEVAEPSPVALERARRLSVGLCRATRVVTPGVTDTRHRALAALCILKWWCGRVAAARRQRVTKFVLGSL